MSKIIGYKAPFDILAWSINKGDIYKKSDNSEFTYDFNGSCYLPKEIVETWEPVYEETQEDLFKELFSSNFRAWEDEGQDIIPELMKQYEIKRK